MIRPRRSTLPSPTRDRASSRSFARRALLAVLGSPRLTAVVSVGATIFLVLGPCWSTFQLSPHASPARSSQMT